jgi:hypothetical protein
MTKPSKTKAATRRRKPARRKAATKPVVASPAIEPETPATDPVPDQVAPVPAQEEIVQEAATAPAVAETDAPSDQVSFGPVEARMKRLSTKVVLGLLSPEGLRRIEAQKGTSSFESTCQRLLATDGRATPVIFEDGDPPTILHGFEELAAAVDSGAATVSVLLIPAGGASEAQAHIVEMVRQQRASKQPSEDDELFYRVHAEG